MKKFKHKHNGDIAELVNNVGYKLNKNTIGLIPIDYIENSNDWELVEDKKPILRTEDGVDLYKGDKYCWVCRNPMYISPNIYDAATCKNNTRDYLYFSTLQAAKEYVNLYKPKFSKAEIQTLIRNKLYKYSIMEDLINSFNYKDE